MDRGYVFRSRRADLAPFLATEHHKDAESPRPRVPSPSVHVRSGAFGRPLTGHVSSRVRLDKRAAVRATRCSAWPTRRRTSGLVPGLGLREWAVLAFFTSPAAAGL